MYRGQVWLPDVSGGAAILHHRLRLATKVIRLAPYASNHPCFSVPPETHKVPCCLKEIAADSVNGDLPAVA